ncbi:hypothetical protein C2G38_2146311 [Gigaspora rosea]|uniref:Crinkler effector protein N-terminal domain-containing protein n=1 Tax=Gigaspora rosea TaxID=44941 RepID=A0A397UIH2_9GLOM|nr:hypothetical protein C2G38_2146311 [Gigaspora rosea]
MSVVISGMPIALFCLVRESKPPFKVTIGRDNDISDFKKNIKNKILNEFPNSAINKIKLWKLNEPVSSKNIEELQNITLQDNENVTLLDETNDIVDYWAEGQIPLKKCIHVIVEPEHLTKKRRIEQGWKSYIASDSYSVELPSKIIDMLKDNKFVPDPRTTFRAAFQNLYVGKSITLPLLGQLFKTKIYK